MAPGRRRLRLASWLPLRCFRLGGAAASGLSEAAPPPAPKPLPVAHSTARSGLPEKGAGARANDVPPPRALTGAVGSGGGEGEGGPRPGTCSRSYAGSGSSSGHCAGSHGGGSGGASSNSGCSSSSGCDVVAMGSAVSDDMLAVIADSGFCSRTMSCTEEDGAALVKNGTTWAAVADVESGAGDPDSEPELMLWRRFNLSEYTYGMPSAWRRLVGLFDVTIVSRRSNDASLGLQAWRSGGLRRWDLRFPVLTLVDTPGRAAPGEGFDEWPLFDIFKIDLRGLSGWTDYLASLRRDDRRNVRQRSKLFRSFECGGRLTCQVVRLGPTAFGNQQMSRQQQHPRDSQRAPSRPAPVPADSDGGYSEGCGPSSAISHSSGAVGVLPMIVAEPLPEGLPQEPPQRPPPASSQPESPAESCSPVRWTLQLQGAPYRPTGELPPPPAQQQQQQQKQKADQQEVESVPFDNLPPTLSRRQQKRQQWHQQRQLRQQESQQTQQLLQHACVAEPLAAGGGSISSKKHAGGDPRVGDDGESAPPHVSFVTPGSMAEAEELVAEMWGLYEQTGARNGFVECPRDQFEQLVRQAPYIHAVVVREGCTADGAMDSATAGGTAAVSCGPLLAFGLLLPQREALEVLYTGMKYDSPIVRQSSSYFQVLSMSLQVALLHNDSVRQCNSGAAVESGPMKGSAAMASTAASAAPQQLITPVDRKHPRLAVESALSALADGTAAGLATTAAATASATLAPPPPLPPAPLLGPRVGVIEWLDLGPGRRFVKEHLGATGHPVSMYTRGVGPIVQLMSRRLLSRYFRPKEYVNDP